MLAFAANSLLARQALDSTPIDAATFTLVRLASGALTLWLIVRISRGSAWTRPDWLAATALFAYAICFSFAYRSLTAATGALILFAAVQLTMIGAGLRAGEALTRRSGTGVLLAVAGLIYLLLPGITAPEPAGAGLMAGAGVAWGLYSLRGRGVTEPLRASAGNFLGAVPLALAAMTPFLLTGEARADSAGLLLVILSGAVASGLGYVIWYAALAGLAATQAATIQLSVPVITALGGVLLLDELLTLRLGLASAAILGGIALVLTRRRTTPARTTSVNRFR